MIVCLIISGICFLIYNGINSWGKNKYGEDDWNAVNKARIESENRKKYNDYMFTCPMCNSKKVMKISDLDREFSFAIWGVASDKIGKQYECDNCHHKW